MLGGMFTQDIDSDHSRSLHLCGPEFRARVALVNVAVQYSAQESKRDVVKSGDVNDRFAAWWSKDKRDSPIAIEAGSMETI